MVKDRCTQVPELAYELYGRTTLTLTLSQRAREQVV